MDFNTLLKLADREAEAAMMKEIAGEISGDPDLAGNREEEDLQAILAAAGEDESVSMPTQEPDMQSLLAAADSAADPEEVMPEDDSDIIELAEAIGYEGPMEEFDEGLEVEEEHGPEGPEGGRFDISQGNPTMEALIAATHLSEDPEYYDKLELMEDGALDDEVDKKKRSEGKSTKSKDSKDKEEEKNSKSEDPEYDDTKKAAIRKVAKFLSDL